MTATRSVGSSETTKRRREFEKGWEGCVIEKVRVERDGTVVP